MKRSLIAAALALAACLAVPVQTASARQGHRAAATPPACATDVMRPCSANFLAGVRSIDVEMKRVRRGRVRAEAAVSFFASANSGLVDRARAYMGGNPTGWRRVWCGRFMAMIAPAAAAKLRNPNMARDWAALPRTSGNIGDIAVLSRGRRGGHVGVVSGFDVSGNPIIVSGNHGHRVGEAVYSRGRVLAFVSAS